VTVASGQVDVVGPFLGVDIAMDSTAAAQAVGAATKVNEPVIVPSLISCRHPVQPDCAEDLTASMVVDCLAATDVRREIPRRVGIDGVVGARMTP